MSDTPLQDALDNLAKNQLEVRGEATAPIAGKPQADLSLTLERERALINGSRSIGVTAGASTSKGGYFAAFWKRVWK